LPFHSSSCRRPSRSRRDTAALVEALNFSIQTITTVGYGNWATGLADRDPALLMLKLISLPTMIVGPAVFGLAISGLTNPAASEPSRRCPHCGAQLS
jgi:hypothetical protein